MAENRQFVQCKQETEVSMSWCEDLRREEKGRGKREEEVFRAPLNSHRFFTSNLLKTPFSSFPSHHPPSDT